MAADPNFRALPATQGSVAATRPSELATNRVLRNTYLLLSATLLFSAAMAGLAMAMGMPYLGPVVTLVGYFGLLFLTSRLQNSAAGIAAVVDLVLERSGRYQGFVAQEQFRLPEILDNRFGRYYAPGGSKDVSSRIVVSGQAGHQRRQRID